jgi:hypothetical protein
MNVNDGPAASRQFEAHPPFWGSKVASKTTPAWQNNFGKSYGHHGGRGCGLQRRARRPLRGYAVAWCRVDAVLRQARLPAHPCSSPFCRCLRLVVVVSSPKDHPFRHERRPVCQHAAGRCVFVQRREAGYLGVTGGSTMGTALHLQSGEHRFILGGRDRRVASGTRLDAPDAGYGLPVDIDAWVSAADFDEIVTMVSRRSGLDVRPPAPGQPARCLLFPTRC